MEEKKEFKFSIVIPTLNEEKYLSRCVDSLLDQSYDPNLIEIVIVDGQSTDKTLEIISKYQKNHNNIKLFENPKKNTPISLNIGIKNSTGDVAVILGAHTKVCKDFVLLNNKYLHQKNVMVTGGTQINLGDTFMQRTVATIMEIPFAMASSQYRWHKKAQYVDTVVYAAYRKELFDELGYFEENFAISEDAEMNWRIRQAGYKIWYSPDIFTYYFARASIKKFIKQMFRYGILRVNVLKKHSDAIKILHLVPPVFVITLISLLIITINNHALSFLLYTFLGLYFFVNIISVIKKIGIKKILEVPIFSIIIFAMHFAWGSGFIIGAILPKSDKW